jgi:hypothetical protein
LENVAVLWQNIPAYLSYNPKYKPIKYVSVCICWTGLYSKIENVKLTANGHGYSTGPIEAVQLVHYRNLTGDGAWVFNEMADAILIARLDPLPVDSTVDEALEYTITGELLQLCNLAGNRAKLSQWAVRRISRTENLHQMFVYLKRTVFPGQSLGKKTW